MSFHKKEIEKIELVARPVDDAEVLEGILVWGIISMPGHHIKWRMILKMKEIRNCNFIN